jgi:hypothetical protein
VNISRKMRCGSVTPALPAGPQLLASAARRSRGHKGVVTRGLELVPKQKLTDLFVERVKAAGLARERMPADPDPADEKKVSCERRTPETERLPHVGEAGFVFSMTGDAPVAGSSRVKRRLDEAAFAAERSERGSNKEHAVHPRPFHGVRRSAASEMAHLKTLVIERILNHTSGTIRSVAAVYNRFACVEGCRAALEAWGRCVDNVAEAPANIIDLKTAC